MYNPQLGIWVMTFRPNEGQPPLWIYFYHTDPLRVSQPPKIGKWCLNRPHQELEQIAHTLAPSIRMGKISLLKWRPQPQDSQGPYAGTLPLMCIYATRETRATIPVILEEHAIRNTYWRGNY